MSNQDVPTSKTPNNNNDYMFGPKIAVGIGFIFMIILVIVIIFLLLPQIGSYILHPFDNEKETIIN